ncbi:hypothetical protein [Nocardia sp. NPDC058497]
MAVPPIGPFARQKRVPRVHFDQHAVVVVVAVDDATHHLGRAVRLV